MDASDGEGTPQLLLDGFTGPLAQLLTLARARQVDLGQLALAALVDQLTDALQRAPTTTSLGEKGGWVAMAAWLIQLRSLLLLPADAPARQGAAIEAEQLRERLIELRAMQRLSAWLEQRPQLGQDVFARGQPEVHGVTSGPRPLLDVIEFLWASLALFDDDAVSETATGHRPYRLDLYDLAAARARIRDRLVEVPEGAALDQFLPNAREPAAGEGRTILRRRSAWASTFTAALELAKQGDVTLGQGADFQTIHLRPAARDPTGP